MIMIIAIIYIFYLMWYLINSWKLRSENPQAPLEKIHSPPFYHPLSKNSRSVSPCHPPPTIPPHRVFDNFENF